MAFDDDWNSNRLSEANCRPAIGIHDTRLRICIDTAELLLGPGQAVIAGTRISAEQELRVVELRCQCGGRVRRGGFVTGCRTGADEEGKYQAFNT